MKFCVLRSGSSGNCTLIEEGESRILLDAGGMSKKGLKRLCAEVACAPEQLSTVIITHLHSDHLNRSTLDLCAELGIPLWVHEANRGYLTEAYGTEHLDKVTIQTFADETFAAGNVVLAPFEVAHDAREVTSGFRFWSSHDPRRSVSYASDLGHFPDPLIERFAGASHIVLESNHDTGLLWNNPNRTYFHKKRVTGPNGHLSNEQAADALVRIFRVSSSPPRAVVLCHLSKDHNTPELAIDTVRAVLGREGFSTDLFTAFRETRTRFFELG